MNVEGMLAAVRLQSRLGAALQKVMQTQTAGDVEGQVAANLEAAEAAEAIVEAMAPFGAEAPLDPATHADLAVRHLSMAVDHLMNLGRLAEAEAAEARAEGIAGRWSSEAARLALRLDQATRRRERGQFAAALATLAEVRDAALAAGIAETAYKAAIRRAETLQWLGDPERALAELEAIRPTAPPIPVRTPSDDPDVAQMQQLEALVAEQSRDTDFHFFRFLCLRDLAASDAARLEEAGRELAIVAPIYSGMGLEATAAFYEADLALRGGRAAEALALAQPLVETFRRDQRLAHKVGAVETIAGRALLALDRVEEAARAAKTAAASLIAAGQEENVWRAHELVAETARRLGDAATQRRALAAGTEAVDRMRLAPLGWRLDNLYLEPRLALYREAITLAGRDGDGPAALRLIEAVKSRALTAMIGGGAAGATAADPELLRRHEALDAAIARTQAEVIAGSAEAGVGDQLQALRRERAQLAERIRFADPRWQVLTAPDTPPPEAIAAAAGQLDAVALDLYLDGPLLTAVVVEGAGITVAQRALTPETLAALQWMLSGLSPRPLPDGQPRHPDPRVKDPAALGLTLAALLPPSVAERLAAAQRLLIAAHGPLHLLAWPVAPLDAGKPRLIAGAEVGLLPNLTCLPALAARPPAEPRCVVIGAPLRDYGPEDLRTLPEAALATGGDVAARYAAKRRLIGSEASGPAATEAAFRALSADPAAQGAILHVTCHGLPPRTEPGDAALLLADVDLEAAALADERIPFAEVVLTACSTGYRPATDWQGIPLSGDDALGLPGAFLEAGAATMLVSIPLAQAAAAHRIAIDYHAARLDGLAPLAAFRRAQLALLADPAFPPRDACGFVLYGCR